ANQLEKARLYYDKAFGSANPRIKSYALYKLAWCDFNAGEHERALKKLQDVVAFVENATVKLTDLKTEALNDMVTMFVQLNRADDAIAYFEKHAGKAKQSKLVAKMADALKDAGHFDNAIKHYRYLLPA